MPFTLRLCGSVNMWPFQLRSIGQGHSHDQDLIPKPDKSLIMQKKDQHYSVTINQKQWRVFEVEGFKIFDFLSNQLLRTAGTSTGVVCL